MSQLIILGQCEVNGGKKGDPERVVKLVGSHHHWLGDDGLEPDRFPEIDRWPERQLVELAVAHFPGEEFSNLAKVQERLHEEFGADGWELAGFPELMTDKLWESLQMLWEQPDIRWIVAPADSAVWLDSHRSRYAPDVFCLPYYRHLHARWVEDGFGGYCCFLLSRKVGEELGS